MKNMTEWYFLISLFRIAFFPLNYLVICCFKMTFLSHKLVSISDRVRSPKIRSSSCGKALMASIHERRYLTNLPLSLEQLVICDARSPQELFALDVSRLKRLRWTAPRMIVSSTSS
jgi:hypothetical protein